MCTSPADGTAHAVDREIQRVLDQAQARVRDTLSARRTALDMIAKLLIETEVVTGDTVTRVLEEHAATTTPRPARDGRRAA